MPYESVVLELTNVWEELDFLSRPLRVVVDTVADDREDERDARNSHVVGELPVVGSIAEKLLDAIDSGLRQGTAVEEKVDAVVNGEERSDRSRRRSDTGRWASENHQVFRLVTVLSGVVVVLLIAGVVRATRDVRLPEKVGLAGEEVGFAVESAGPNTMELRPEVIVRHQSIVGSSADFFLQIDELRRVTRECSVQGLDWSSPLCR